MGEFGKRTMNAMQASPRWDASDAPRQSTPAWSDQISERDLKALEKGQLPPWTNMSRSKLLSLAFFVMAMVLGAVALYGPEVARDLRYAGTFRVADDLRATEGRCKRYVFLVSLCSVKIHSVRSEQSTSSTEFLMFFRSGDGAEMIPVRSNVDASAVGIQYAVSDVLLNRILSLLGITLFFFWIAWKFVDCIRKGRYKDGPGHEAIRQCVTQSVRTPTREIKKPRNVLARVSCERGSAHVVFVAGPCRDHCLAVCECRGRSPSAFEASIICSDEVVAVMRSSLRPAALSNPSN